MDGWPPGRKRSFADMSQAATLSPSPMAFGDPSANFLNSQHYNPPSNNSQSSRAGSFFGPRRLSHPHNPPLHPPSEGMAERSHGRSRLGAQASVIDLTDDSDDRPIFAGARSHSQRPPQLGRSDAVRFENFIDLTEDAEPDLVITGVQERRRPEGIQRVRVPPARAGRVEQARRPVAREDTRSPSMFLQQAPVILPPQPAAANLHRVFGNPAHFLDRIGGVGQMFGVAHGFMDQIMYYQGLNQQAMPANNMDYQANAFAPRKPEHVPPPAAKAGFTRSPLETDIVICPSCEEEMVHKKEEEPVTKKGGKAPSKKDREEHPFWVVKECGHVYCNHCYQNRQTANKGSSTVSFPELTKAGKTGNSRQTKILGCAVDGCESDVKSKDKWVGVFL